MGVTLLSLLSSTFPVPASCLGRLSSRCWHALGIQQTSLCTTVESTPLFQSFIRISELRLEDWVDHVLIPEPSLWTAEGWPMSSPTPTNGEGAGVTNPHWMGDGVGITMGGLRCCRRSQTSDVHRNILLMKPALSWLSSSFLELSLILSWNLPFFSFISFPYFPWYFLLLADYWIVPYPSGIVGPILYLPQWEVPSSAFP